MTRSRTTQTYKNFRKNNQSFKKYENEKRCHLEKLLHELDLPSSPGAEDMNVTRNCVHPGPVPQAGPVTIADASVRCAREISTL